MFFSSDFSCKLLRDNLRINCGFLSSRHPRPPWTQIIMRGTGHQHHSLKNYLKSSIFRPWYHDMYGHENLSKDGGIIQTEISRSLYFSWAKDKNTDEVDNGESIQQHSCQHIELTICHWALMGLTTTHTSDADEWGLRTGHLILQSQMKAGWATMLTADAIWQGGRRRYLFIHACRITKKPNQK